MKPIKRTFREWLRRVPPSYDVDLLDLEIARLADVVLVRLVGHNVPMTKSNYSRLVQGSNVKN